MQFMIDSQCHLYVIAQQRLMGDPYGHSFSARHTMAEMSESEFIGAVLEEADCLLHLDVNNLYVNSCNFAFDPLTFLDALPLERVCYLHVAGHYREPDGLLIDTHGAPVIDPVWSLLEAVYARIGARPSCLERDFNLPDLAELTREVEIIERLQTPFLSRRSAA
jgi:uncharacterized protein (UPF0276 family)